MAIEDRVEILRDTISLYVEMKGVHSCKSFEYYRIVEALFESLEFVRSVNAGMFETGISLEVDFTTYLEYKDEIEKRIYDSALAIERLSKAFYKNEIFKAGLYLEMEKV